MYTGFPHAITLIPLASNLFIYSLSLTSVKSTHSNSSYFISCSRKSFRYMPTPLGLLPRVLASTAIFNFFISVLPTPIIIYHIKSITITCMFKLNCQKNMALLILPYYRYNCYTLLIHFIHTKTPACLVILIGFLSSFFSIYFLKSVYLSTRYSFWLP